MPVRSAADVERHIRHGIPLAANVSADTVPTLPVGSAISSAMAAGSISGTERERALGQAPRTTKPRFAVTHEHVAVTAIEYGDIVVTVTSRFLGDDHSSSEIRPMPYLTSIAGGPLSGWTWTSRTWSKALHNHVTAAGLVADAFASERP
jgi:hypothetical protein